MSSRHLRELFFFHLVAITLESMNTFSESSVPVPSFVVDAPHLRVIDVRGRQLSSRELKSIVPRQGSEYVGSAQRSVNEILARVKSEGAPYLRELSLRFDDVEQGALRVPAEALKRATDSLDAEVRRGLEIAIERTRAFAQVQRPDDARIEVAPGSVLVTHSPEVVEQVQAAIARRAVATKHAERVKQALEGEQSGVVLTDSLEQSIAVADAYAVEHLEIHTENAREVAARIRNAGAIFIGSYSPVPLGDYAAGSNHVLPTGGSASFGSGLCTTSFMKAVQLIEYSESALAEIGKSIVAVAENEDLPAHGEAITARTESHR